MENCSASRLRRKSLRDDISLDDLLKYGRGLERSDHQLKTVEEDHNRTALVNKMQQLRINNNQRRANNSSLANHVIFVVKVVPIKMVENHACGGQNMSQLWQNR
jgi:hypothetical protein